MRPKVLIVIGSATAVLLLAGCGSNDTSTSEPSTSAVSEPSMTVPADTTPTAIFGETQEITSEGFAVGLSDYTVSNPRVEGTQYVFDLAIDTKQGQCIPGVFAVLTDQGVKVENVDSPNQAAFDTSGTMIAGEKRQGAVYFDVPPGSEVTKFVLYHGTVNPPKANWAP